MEAFATDGAARRFQQASLAAARSVANAINNDECGSTPERLQLYSPNLINEVNNAYLVAAARRPTVYEALAALNSTAFLENPALWRKNLGELAASAAQNPSPPSIDFRYDPYSGIVLVANAVSEASFLGKINGKVSYSPSLFLLGPVEFDTKIRARGFLRVVSPAGRNLIVIDQNLTAIGYCGSTPGIPCY